MTERMTGRPRLLILLTAGTVGGMELHVLRLAPALASRFDCTVGCLETLPSYEERLASTGVRVENLAIGPLTSGAALVRGLSRLRTLLRKVRPDVIQLYGFTCELWAPAIRLVAPRSIILTSRRSNETNRRHTWWRRRTNAFCDAVISVSEETAAHTVRHERVPRHKLITIPNGVSIPDVSRPPQSSGRLRFGTLGNVKPVKGTDMLVDAFLKLSPDAPVELHIAGSIGARQRDRDWALSLVESARRSHAADRIKFCGHREDASDFLRDLDVFVLPSRSEGMSNALLEAMAHGLPCVATDVGSNRSVLSSAGLVCEPNPDALFAAMQQLYASAGLRQAFAERARARAIESFSHEAMVAAYSTLYADLLAARRPAYIAAPSPRPTGKVL